jgi:two-component system cell cycle response regulator DivK
MARVLVVEDNPVNMKLAALLLDKGGHKVLCAADAEAGLLLARSERPDLILMDIQLPGMDGLEAAALLKQDPATAAIPVIALTAMAMEVGNDNSRLLCCDACIAKPLRYQELYAAIDVVLGVGKSPSSRQGSQRGVAFVSQPSPDEPVPCATSMHAVDVGTLKGLIGDEPTAIREFQNSFRISAAKIALDLKAACDARQPDLAGRQAHKLRSSAYTVGARALGNLCAEMEAAGKVGNTETLAKLLPLFEQELEAVDAFLDAFR